MSFHNAIRENKHRALKVLMLCTEIGTDDWVHQRFFETTCRQNMIVEKQIEIVKAIASDIRSPWDKVTLNVEVGGVSGSEVVSGLGHYWLDDKKEQIILSGLICQMFRELRRLMSDHDSKQRFWSICDVIISSTGHYDYKFSYEPPGRITALKNAK